MVIVIGDFIPSKILGVEVKANVRRRKNER